MKTSALILILILAQNVAAEGIRKTERADLSAAIQEGFDNQMDTHKEIQEKLGVEKLVDVAPIQYEPALSPGPVEHVVVPTSEEVQVDEPVPAKKSKRSPASIDMPISKELKSEIESADAE